MDRFRKHLTFANVVSLIALFVALGGTAMAAVIITDNSQVAQDTISGHHPPTGEHSNLIASSVNGQDVDNNSVTGSDVKQGSLTGLDIQDRSGVDTCQTPLTAQFGPICAGSDGVARGWFDAQKQCGSFGLRLPTTSEAMTLATNYNVPGVADDQYFWTDGEAIDGADDVAATVWEDGSRGPWKVVFDLRSMAQTVCVTDPSA
jgi:hypothetical protein